MMNKPSFLLTLFLLCFAHLVAAQYITVMVKEKDGSPIGNAQMAIFDAGSEQASNTGKADALGKAKLRRNKEAGKPSKVVVVAEGFRQVSEQPNYNHEAQKITVIMQPTARFLKGKVANQHGLPILGCKVNLKDYPSVDFTSSNERGFFRLQVSDDIPLDEELVFLVNGKTIDNAHYKFNASKTYYALKVKGIHASFRNETVIPTFLVKVYQNAHIPVKNTKVYVNNLAFQTSNLGSFKVQKALTKQTKFRVQDFLLADVKISEKTKEVTIYVKKEQVQVADNQEDKNENMAQIGDEYSSRMNAIDSIIIDDQRDFNYVINELEIEKQQLTERSVKLREEMERIANRLLKTNGDKNLTAQRQKALEAYLQRLEKALIDNELTYQLAQEKTKAVIDQMRRSIMKEDSLKLLAETELKKTAAEKEKIEQEFEQDMLIGSIVMGFLIIIAVVGYFLAVRIRRQRNALKNTNLQLEVTKDELADKIEEINTQKEQISGALQNMQLISYIGQQITSERHLDTLTQKLHTSVNSLLDAAVFGLGIANEKTRQVEFKDYVEKGVVYPKFSQSMDDDTKFAGWSLKHNRTVLISDIANDYKDYLKVKDFPLSADMPQSLIYQPLSINGKPVGVITVQSFEKNAYSSNDITVLKALGAYIAIALANAKAYEDIKSKQKSITDSIRYAQTIQDTILPNEKILKRQFDEHFIVFNPKDIVSGDFYWFADLPATQTQPERIFVAVVDCTGHGVPGAFMSMVGHDLLNEIVLQKQIYEPAEVLTRLNKGVIKTLKQEQKTNDDGMDVCFCVIEKQEDSYKICFAGAKRPLYYLKAGENELQTLKGNRKSVGGLHNKDFVFSQQELNLEKGDTLYLTTDGLVDQNAPDKKKFGTQRLKALLSENANRPLLSQKEEIQAALDTHKQYGEQRDDITLMGIKL